MRARFTRTSALLSVVAATAFVFACGSDAISEADPDQNDPDGAVRIDPDTGEPITDDGGTPIEDGAGPQAQEAVMIGAGDISSCSGTGGNASEATAKILDKLSGTIFTAGDNAYATGTDKEFTCYDARWGRQKARTLPAPGNHDYLQKNAAPYFKYFGAAAGDPTKGYYSKDVGPWHVIVINSNCAEIGGCAATSPQAKWLEADLAAHTQKCTMAIWHHPLYNMGNHGPATEMKPIWQILYDHDADLVVNGHDHNYQRWKPQTPAGKVDEARGIVELLVGTGGAAFYDFDPKPANIEVNDNVTFGVIKLTLRPTDMDFEFVPVEGQTFTDKGTITCH